MFSALTPRSAMFFQDLPEAILEQEDELTRLADDCELIQHLVANAARTWEEKLSAARRDGPECETRDFVDADGCLFRAHLHPPDVVFESADGMWQGATMLPGEVSLDDVTTDELRRLLDEARDGDF